MFALLHPVDTHSVFVFFYITIIHSRQFSALSSVDIVPVDISVAGRILAAFPETLDDNQRVPDNLAFLGDQTLKPDCAIVKLPNVSAPITQLQDCIAELRSKGYDVPLYPWEPQNDKERDIQQRYNRVSGSAVNPVLREGNSDRRVAPPVKAYARKNPHRMGIWSKASRTHVAHMTEGDFYGSELSATMPHDGQLEIVLEGSDGNSIVLKDTVNVVKDEVVDASYMSIRALTEFYENEIDDAKESEILLSLHLKATMMKVSDPILFGHAIKVFYRDLFAKHGDALEKLGANPNRGLANVLSTAKEKMSSEEYEAFMADLDEVYENRPWLAMVDSDRGITNLHAPNDIIIGT